MFHRYNSNIHCLTLHALRDICAGEEILTSYIDICNSTAERRRILQHWGFECGCDICFTEDAEQDRRRSSLARIILDMKLDESRDAEQVWSTRQHQKALSTAVEAIALMEEEGMYESDTLAEMYSKAAEHAVAVGSVHKGYEWALKAAEIELKCCGKDSSDFAKADTFVISLEGSQ